MTIIHRFLAITAVLAASIAGPAPAFAADPPVAHPACPPGDIWVDLGAGGGYCMTPASGGTGTGDGTWNGGADTPLPAPEPLPTPPPYEPLPCFGCGPLPTPSFSDLRQSAFPSEIRWMADRGISTGWVNADGSRRYAPHLPVARDAMAAFLYRVTAPQSYTPPRASPFRDITPATAFYREMTWMSAKRVSMGWEDGTYRPLTSTDRATMAAFLYRLAGEPAYTAPSRSAFSDVPATHPFYCEISWLASTGISRGWADGTFRPSVAVSRETMAAFLYRFDTNF